MVSKSERFVSAELFRSAPLSFGESFVKSEGFKLMFRDGMALIEDAADYLDGDGRADAADLSRQASLLYAAESMRLTTRLMQIASWLLVQRAVSEGEISSLQARREKDRVRLTGGDRSLSQSDFAILPDRLRDLIASSYRLHARVAHLDRLVMGAAEDAETRPRPCPVAMQQNLLAVAFAAH